MAGCLQGDEEAWTLLWQRYGPLVRSVAFRVGCNAEETCEVMQRVALATVMNLQTLRNPAKIAGWLASTTRAWALAALRQRQPHDQLDPSFEAPESRIDDVLIHQERLALMWRAFHQLDPRCQRMLLRLDLSDPAQSYEEVAAAEGLATSSVGPIRTRCLQRLRRLLEGKSNAAEPQTSGNGFGPLR